MQYNVAKEGIIEVNLTEGNVSADFDSMMDLMDNTASVYLDGASDDIFCLDIDLGARTQIIDIRYFFDSTLDTSIISPTISFYYKNDPADSYTNIATSIGSNYYYAAVSGVSAPRYIRLMHTVSGTAVSGTATGFITFNDDTTVDFGEDGTRTTMSVVTASDSTTINAIAVFNSGDLQANAQVFIEPVQSISEYIFISDSEDGPWVGMADTPLAEADFGAGIQTHYDGDLNTTELNSQLKIADLATGAGKYITKIVNKTQGTAYSMLNVDGTFPAGSALKTDATDGTETYEVKLNTSKPKSFRFYTHYGWGYIGSTAYSYNRNQYWLDNNQTKYAAPDGVYGVFITANFTGNGEEILPNNPNRGFILVTHTAREGFYNYYYTSIVRYTDRTRDCTNFWFSNATKVNLKYDSGSVNVIETYRMWADSSDGIWLYYRVVSGSSLTAGYYLKHYTWGLSATYSFFSADKTIYDIDVVYADDYLWISDIGTASLRKINITGVELYSYDAETLETVDPRGVCALADGGCWFVNGDYDIHRLDTEASLITSITEVDAPEALKYVLLDKDDSGFLWLISSNYLSLFQLDGERVVFSEVLPSATATVKSYIGGLAFVFTDKSFAFFDKASRSFSATRATSFMTPGVFASEYSDELVSGTYYPQEDLCTGGTASASSNTSTAYYAFDNSASTLWTASSTSVPQWVAYDFGAANKVTAQCVRMQSGSERSQNFYIQASNDAVDWVNLSYNTLTSSQASDRWNEIYFSNTVAFRYYRIYFTYFNGNNPSLRQMEICKVTPIFPNELDTSWNAKEWQKVSYANHLISPDEYKQFRLTMRSDGVADPTVDNIYLYDGVQLSNIGPKQYKNAYVKLVTPPDSTNILGDHDTNIKVWWDVPL